MKLPKFQFVRPKSFKELFKEWGKYGSSAALVAGATDLFPRMKYRLTQPEVIISLNGLEKLKTITVSESGQISIGALATLHQVFQSEKIQKNCPSLCEAAGSVASNQIRRMGTIGGNICLETRCLYFNQSHSHQFMEPCFKRGGTQCYLAPKGKKCMAVHMADTAPALISLGAQLILRGRQRIKKVPLEKFYTGESIRPFLLNPYEIVEGISLDQHIGLQSSAYVKHTLRNSLEFGIVGVAVWLALDNSQGRCLQARIVLGCISGGPISAAEAEQVLIGNELNNKVIEKTAQVASESIRAYPHHGYSRQYIKEMIRVYTRKAIVISLNRANANGS